MLPPNDLIRYGQDMGDASRIGGQLAQNVALVYIDIRGVGRRALLKRAGKAVVRARMGGRDVMLGPPEHGKPMDNRAVQHAAFFPGVQPTQNVPRR